MTSSVWFALLFLGSQDLILQQASMKAVPSTEAGLTKVKDACVELERNKEVVRRLFKIIYGTSLDDIDKIDEIVAADYIQHNPRAQQGRAGLKDFLKIIIPEPKELDPADTINVTFIAEGDLVVRQEMRRNGMLVDIFRVRNGMLTEHWDAFRFAPGAKVIPGF
jgi:predicted SnoaL-like aldol condensation-catalyzing enzyme